MSRRSALTRGLAPLAGAGLLGGLGGCQTYSAVPLSAAPNAESVRVILTAAAAERLAPVLGPNVSSVDGRVDAAGGDTLRLTVREAVLRNGQSVEWTGERVTLRTADVAELQRRRPSTARTALLGGSIVGVAIAVAALVGTGGGGGFVGTPPGQSR